MPCLPHLSRGGVVLQRVDAEAQDVIVVAQVEALAVQLTVVDHAHRCNVVQHLPALRVKQVVPAVVATVTAQRNHFLVLHRHTRVIMHIFG